MRGKFIGGISTNGAMEKENHECLQMLPLENRNIA